MGKGRYLLKRLIYIIFVFFIISILMFGIYKATPGDPVEMMIGGNKMNMKPEMYQQQYEQVTEILNTASLKMPDMSLGLILTRYFLAMG